MEEILSEVQKEVKKNVNFEGRILGEDVGGVEEVGGEQSIRNMEVLKKKKNSNLKPVSHSAHDPRSLTTTLTFEVLKKKLRDSELSREVLEGKMASLIEDVLGRLDENEDGEREDDASMKGREGEEGGSSRGILVRLGEEIMDTKRNETGEALSRLQRRHAAITGLLRDEIKEMKAQMAEEEAATAVSITMAELVG